MVTKEKIIDINEINHRIKRTKLSERDSSNRPKEFKIRKPNSKYEGNAGSLRILGRILPLILTKEFEKSDKGDALIKLEEVSQLITAPKLTIGEIENTLHFTIIEYLDLRRDMVDLISAPTLKPKHHFLSHYSKLYKEVGPLIHLWAMRMESKHTFFKSCIRTAKCFRNVTKTCAVRHQRAQISYSYSGLFPPTIQLPSSSPTLDSVDELTVNQEMVDIRSRFPNDSLVPHSVRIHSTEYKPGQVLVLRVKHF